MYKLVLKRFSPYGLVLLATVAITACARDESPVVTGSTVSVPTTFSADASQPTIANDMFGGEFAIVRVVAANVEVTEFLDEPSIVIESQFGTLTVNTGCNTLLGSFTLDSEDNTAESGDASFTITGGTQQACSGERGTQEFQIWSVLAAATSWEKTENGFVFLAPSGEAGQDGVEGSNIDSVEISRS